MESDGNVTLMRHTYQQGPEPLCEVSFILFLVLLFLMLLFLTFLDLQYQLHYPYHNPHSSPDSHNCATHGPNDLEHIRQVTCVC